MNLGYACINMQLSYPQQYGGKEKGVKPITTGRSMIKRTFDTKGVDYASELTLANAMDLDKIIDWNILNGYKFFRITSGLAPWKSEYEWEDLKDLKRIQMYLHSAGIKSKTHGLRITSHPGPFNVLTSPHEHVVQNCVGDLTMHGDVFDMLGQSRTHYNKINIHIGGVYGDKVSAMERFCENFHRLPNSVKSRLTVENDDKASMWSVKHLYEYIYSRVGVPIVFDYHHHRFCTGGLSEGEALKLAVSTWKSAKPVVHLSESRREEQGDAKIKEQAHSDYVYTPVDNYGCDYDMMIEAKAKELSLVRYRDILCERMCA